jgi:hypothetical protein
VRVLLAALLALALASAASAALDAGPRCPPNPPAGPAGLPAPVLLTTGCGTFEVRSDGAVREVTLPRRSAPAVDPWLRKGRGNAVLVDERRQVLWRSAGRWDGFLNSGAVRGDRLAFSVAGRLYVARRDGREHAVALGEEAIVWTAAGELVTGHRRGTRVTLRARDADGRLLRVLAEDVRLQGTDWERAELYFSRRGILHRTDGRTVRRLADLRSLGISPWLAWVQPLRGGLLTLQGPGRVAVLDRAGALFATAAFRRAERGGPMGFTVEASPDGARVALGGWWTKDYKTGTDGVWVLEQGDRRARLLERRPVRIAFPCGREVRFAWHGSALLTATNEGRIRVLDTEGARPPVDLSGLAARLADRRRLPWIAWAEWTS